MNCCDTRPMAPTCEEMSDFLDQIGIPADSPLRDYPDSYPGDVPDGAA